MSGVTIVPAVCAMPTVHEQVTESHQADEAISEHRAGRHVKGKDGNQCSYEARAQDPRGSGDTKRTIGSSGSVLPLNLSFKPVSDYRDDSKSIWDKVLESFGLFRDRPFGLKRIKPG